MSKKAKILEPGDWNDPIPAGANWYMGVELEYTPGPQVETHVLWELLMRGMTMPSYNCRPAGNNFVKNCELPQSCCKQMRRYGHILGHISMVPQQIWEAALDASDTADWFKAPSGNKSLHYLVTRYAAGYTCESIFANDEDLRRELMKFVNMKISDVRYPYDSWVLKSDPTCGMELVSPPLNMSNPHCIDSLQKACEAILAAEGEANARCGLHVHTNVFHLTDQQVRRVMLWYRMLEPFLVLPTSTVRLSSDQHSVPWCRTESMRKLDEFISRRNDNRNTKLCQLNKQSMSALTGHYGALSTQAMRGHGTLEIRLKEGTLEFEDIHMWMLLVQRFFVAATYTKPPLWPDYWPIQPTAKSLRLFLRWMRLWPSNDPLARGLAFWYIKNSNKPSLDWVTRRSLRFKELVDGRFVSPEGQILADMVFTDPKIMPVQLLVRVSRYALRDMDPTVDTGIDIEGLLPLQNLPEDEDEALKWVMQRGDCLLSLAQLEQEIKKALYPGVTSRRIRSGTIVSRVPRDLADEIVAYYG